MTAMWDFSTLAEACEIKPSKDEVRKRLSDTDAVSFVPMEDLGIDRKHVSPSQTRQLSEVIGSYTYFAEGDVLLAKITPCFENGKLGIAKGLESGVGFGSSEYIVFRPGPRLDAQWLYYFLSRDAFRVEGEARMGGAVGHKRVAKEFIETYAIPLPSLKEQQRIVRILDEAFAGIATVKTNTEKSLRSAREALEIGIERVFENAANLRRLGSVCNFENGDRGKNYPGKQHRVPMGIPFINAGHLTNSGIDFSEMDYISADRFALLGNGKIRAGDTLFCLRGSLGKFANVGDLNEGAIASSLVILRPKDELDSAYLQAFLASRQCLEQIDRLKGGAAQPNLGAKDLKQFVLPLPSIEAQRHVVTELDNLRNEISCLKSLYTRKLAAFDELKQSLLHQAFSGQI